MGEPWRYGDDHRRALEELRARPAQYRNLDLERDVATQLSYPPVVNLCGHVMSMAQMRDDGEGRGTYIIDHQNRRWLLDGSGDVA